MTLVAVWRHGPGRIHAIADTRSSDGPGSVYTDHGPKLLPLTTICRQPGPSGFIDQIKCRHEFGFAFAGSTLTALSAHALANILFGNLVGQPDALPPSLDEIARAAGVISFQYTKEIAATGGAGSVFSAILFGHCPRTEQSLAFEFQPSIGQSGIQIDMTKHVLEEKNVVIIGNKPQLLMDEIKTIRTEATHEIIIADAPMIALKRLIAQNALESVGGSVQQAWAHSSRLEIVATGEPITPNRQAREILDSLSWDSTPLICKPSEPTEYYCPVGRDRAVGRIGRHGQQPA
jgi:hypothetical protein